MRNFWTSKHNIKKKTNHKTAEDNTLRAKKIKILESKKLWDTINEKEKDRQSNFLKIGKMHFPRY